MRDSLILAPVDEESYVYDISLVRAPEGAAVAAWVEWRGKRECVCVRIDSGKRWGDILRIESRRGHPATPRFCGDRLLWTEYRGARGILMQSLRDLSSEGFGRATAAPLPVEMNAGEFACVADAEGAPQVLVEDWRGNSCTIRHLTNTGKEWLDRGCVSGDAFCIRPRLILNGTGLTASWDEYSSERYRVIVSSQAGGATWSTTSLPLPDGTRESLSSIAAAGNGELFAARCRERLVDLDSAAIHHSELYVAVKMGSDWQDVARVDIDFALNPWTSAYWGWRRFPVLMPDRDGVWLCWEEKLDTRSMGPGPGRLRALYVTASGAPGDPIVLIDDHSMFVLEQGADASHFLVATKTLRESYELHIPYQIHEVNTADDAPARPEPSESNRNAPVFEVRPVASRQPQMADEKLFFGDLHIHSHLSYDLPGEPDELYLFARDVAKLDFVCFAENDATRFTGPLSPCDWERSRRLAETFNDPGRFTSFIAWEYTLHRSPKYPRSLDSHRCVVFPALDARIVSWFDDSAPTPEELRQAFQGERVLLHYHHPRPPDVEDDSLERNVEVSSGWAISMGVQHYVDRLHTLLDQGLKFGLFASSDNHERNPGLGGGLAGVWAKENTREAIFDAFWNRRVFGTTGLRPDIRFSVSGCFMGGSADIEGPPQIHVAVKCDVPVCMVEIIADGHVAERRECDSNEIEVKWTDIACTPGDHYYYVHIVFEGETKSLYFNQAPAYGNQAWTSPVWIQLVGGAR